MTEQEERIQRAEQAIAAIEGLYGVRIVATVERMADGTILFDTMKPRVVALANWQPPQVESQSHEIKPGTPGVTSFVDPLTLERPAKAFANGAHDETGRFEE
jgi:hypothetical protein